MEKQQQPSPLSGLLHSRKGVLVVFVLVLGLLMAVGLTIAAILGHVEWKEYFTYMSVVITLVTGVVFKTIESIALEDAAAKGAPKIEAAQFAEVQSVEPPAPVVDHAAIAATVTEAVAAALAKQSEKGGAS